MKYLIIKIGICILNLLYSFFKILPLRKRIVFISRQSNKESLDIYLLKNELKKKNKNLEIVVLCKKIESGLKNKLLYVLHMFVQMYYLATSKIIVLDGYCICASILKKKKGTIIIQMWHAMGAFKKFGYSILGMEEGSNAKLAKVMKMHNNYDCIFTSSDKTKKYFAEAFNYDLSKIVILPLPRVDRLTDNEYKKEICEKICRKYSLLKRKKNIVYVPTFRKDYEDKTYINNLINEIDFSKYNLIIKLHPLSKLKITDKRVIVDKKFTSTDMMMMGDFVITDYSAIVFEAAILNKPLFFYCYDYDKYFVKRNFYIDYKKEMPGIISDNPKEIVEAIENKYFDLKKVNEFSRKYVEYKKNKCTLNIVEFILKKM